MTLSEKELIRMAKKRQAKAFEKLFNTYKSRVASFIYKYTNDLQLTEDLTQEVFIRVYKKLPDFEIRESFRAWLFKIATNLVRDNVRKKNRRIKSLFSLDDPAMRKELNGRLMRALEDNTYRGDLSTLSNEIKTSIIATMKLLNQNYRKILLLCDFLNLSYKEAGKIMDCSEKSISVRLTRARRKFIKEYNKGFHGLDEFLED